jgi:transposase
VLATLDREWDGLTAHRDYPMISLDNNAAERALRRPVVTRKNAYGSRNDDAARLAARVWTVTATAEMAGLNVLTYLTAYLDACGRNGAKPLRGWRVNVRPSRLDLVAAGVGGVECGSLMVTCC